MKRVKPTKVSLAPYLKKENALAILNLDQAKTVMEEAYKEFTDKCDSYKVAASHFDEIITQYEVLMADASAARRTKDVHMLKKTTASLEILAQNLKKNTKEFERRYKKLIAEAEATAQGDGKQSGK